MNVIKMAPYGFKSARQFLMSTNIQRATFDAIITDRDWKVVKQVLLHKECPMDIRERFRNDATWYKRFTAIYAKNAPMGYARHGFKDPHKHVNRFAKQATYASVFEFLQKLFNGEFLK